MQDLIYQMHWLEDMKHRDIALNLHVPRATITRWFRHFKLPTQSCRRFTDKNLTSWLYKTGQLKKKVRYAGPDRRIQVAKSRVNVDFFKKWSAGMAYVLGYFAADGSMYINPNGSKYIAFYSNDLEILKKIKFSLNSGHKIALRKRYNKNWKDSFILQIGSAEMYKDLIKLGFSPKKELRLKLPKVPRRYLRHFIRGYFDGDGNISYNYYRKSTNPNAKFMHQQIIFAAANKNFVKALENRLSEVAKISYSCFKSAKDSNSHYLIYYRQKEILKLIKFMYSNVNSLLYLNRKYDKFMSWKRLIGDVA
ncbi:MAG: LAGLIDADG family homing endonuclease [Candidatus Omnitrophica bacterium]|nr:LAGLIDADG family homing endonuclease [Candidatus Omnitrophota bacterium]